MITFQQRAQSARFEESTLHFDTNLIQKPEEPEPKYTTKWFPNRGGILGCIVSFGWLIRMNVWLIILAKALNESKFDGSNTYPARNVRSANY